MAKCPAVGINLVPQRENARHSRSLLGQTAASTLPAPVHHDPLPRDAEIFALKVCPVILLLSSVFSRRQTSHHHRNGCSRAIRKSAPDGVGTAQRTRRDQCPVATFFRRLKKSARGRCDVSAAVMCANDAAPLAPRVISLFYQRIFYWDGTFFPIRPIPHSFCCDSRLCIIAGRTQTPESRVEAEKEIRSIDSSRLLYVPRRHEEKMRLGGVQTLRRMGRAGHFFSLSGPSSTRS